MSPWGKFYLENMSYHPGWWSPFASWRMFSDGVLNHVIDIYGPIDSPRFIRVADHLDKLHKQLENPDWRFPCG